MKQKAFSLLIAVATFIMISGVAFASDVTDADYSGIIRATNTGTTVSGVAVNFTMNTTAMVAAGMFDDTVTNLASRYGASDVEIMPGIEGNPWIVWFDTVAANATSDANFYTGNVTGGDIQYSPGASGMSTADAVSMELGGEFHITQIGRFDSAAGANKRLAYKSGSLDWSFDSSTDDLVTATLYSNTAVEKQLQEFYQFSVYTNNTEGSGQRIDDFPITTIDSVEFYGGGTVGSPPGTVYCRLRRASDMALLHTFGSVTATSWQSGWNLFGTNYNNTIVQDLVFTIEYSSGDSSNKILIRGYNDVYSEGVRYWCNTLSTDPWAADTGKDMTFRITYGPATRTVSATTPEDGRHKYELISDGTDLSIEIDDVEEASTSMKDASMVDNGNTWYFCQNDSLMFLESQNVTVSGTMVQFIEWEYTTGDFSDSSGYGNDATPTYRTTSSDADVTAGLISFQPVSTATVSTDTATAWPTLMDEEDPPELPDTTFTEEEQPGIFFEPLVHALASATDMPDSLFWYNFAFTFIIGFGILAYYLVAKRGTPGGKDSGKLFIKIMVQAALMCFFALPGLNIFGFFVPLYYLFFSIGIFALSLDYGW